VIGGVKRAGPYDAHSVRPIVRPIIIAGSPLSYWDGVHGENLRGMVVADRAPATSRQKIQTAAGDEFRETSTRRTLSGRSSQSLLNRYRGAALSRLRALQADVNLNAVRFNIVDQLFVGNNFAAGKIQTSDGNPLDLRNVRSPIVVFCSEGDNITPPPEALGWIPRLYESVDDIRSHEQTIVYSVHQKSVTSVSLSRAGSPTRNTPNSPITSI
jgi:hypothetical protein